VNFRFDRVADIQFGTVRDGNWPNPARRPWARFDPFRSIALPEKATRRRLQGSSPFAAAPNSVEIVKPGALTRAMAI